MTTIKVVVRDAGIDEYPDEGSDATPLADRVGDCLIIYDGDVVTTYPLSAVVCWTVDPRDGAAS